MWLKVGTQHYTGPLPCLPEDTVGCMELLCCLFWTAAALHMDDWALDHASSSQGYHLFVGSLFFSSCFFHVQTVEEVRGLVEEVRGLPLG